MYYSIRHVTTFHYSEPISESVMEARMQPRSEGAQRCLSFSLRSVPKAQVMAYKDYLGNNIHHFDIPGKHQKLSVIAEAVVEVKTSALVREAVSPDVWKALDEQARSEEFFDFLIPSTIAQPTPLLHDLAAELRVERRGDPLSLLRELTRAMYDTFAYVPESTRVDSPIDDALTDRKGVCQDYTHIMIALVRELGIPCRYVSGYLFHRGNGSEDRSAGDASHAWVEAWLPELGWIGFDPTNNLICDDRHIRVAIGRDYADVPPTRGVFKGAADTKLEVAVKVEQTDDLPSTEETPLPDTVTREEVIPYPQAQMQQQQ
jgi:transglutaminase-like putative cysteine protease